MKRDFYGERNGIICTIKENKRRKERKKERYIERNRAR